ncbi:MAG TPA: endonuclease/exonuclease/phosphatase family protein [Aggregatilineales bacterium]|nr:endonuclease/exonuclease/phosphatase family protein [Aggregatilineales bacterium]
MSRNRRDTVVTAFFLIEAALVGIFFISAFRFVYAALYAHVSSASIVNVTSDITAITAPGVVLPPDAQTELIVAAIGLFVPLLSFIFARLWFGPALIAIVVAAGRVFLTTYGSSTVGVIAGIVTVSGGLLYLATIAIRRPNFFPLCLIIGFGWDQLNRISGSTMDMTVTTDFLVGQTVLSLGLFATATVGAVLDRLRPPPEGTEVQRGEIGGWGAFALAGLLYAEFAVLGLPNTVARHAGIDYLAVAPWLLVATLLPLLPPVREATRRFLGMFDGQFRGWVWVLFIGLLIVVGFRFNGALAAGTLILAQLLVSLSWWWVVQPAAESRNFTGPSLIFGTLLFLALTGADFFTYEYAFVRNVVEPFGSVLRSFRGMGLAVVLFAILLIGLPAILAHKRLPWRGGQVTETLVALVAVVMAGVFAATIAQPVVARPPQDPSSLRIATLNLHSGFSLYFDYGLQDIVKELRDNNFDIHILLLQETETGRMTSFGVDQPAWLARQLNMLVEYYPTNENLQGLAILSRLPFEHTEGVLLPSLGRQTGVQYARLRAQDGAELNIYNTQLGLLLKDTGQTLQAQEQDQVQQLQQIFGYISQNDPNTRTIVGGTFNNVPESDIYNYMKQTFIDPFAGRPQEKVVTLKLVNGGTARMDYLWLRQITVQYADVVNIDASTHDMPVIQIGLLQSTG